MLCYLFPLGVFAPHVRQARVIFREAAVRVDYRDIFQGRISISQRFFQEALADGTPRLCTGLYCSWFSFSTSFDSNGALWIFPTGTFRGLERTAATEPDVHGMGKAF